MEDQDAGLHPLHAALLLVTRPLEPAIHGDDLRDLQALSVDDPLRPRPLLAWVDLRDPDAERFVRSPKPLERGLGEKMGADAGCERHWFPPSGQPPARGRPQGQRQEHQEERHSLSHPLRRNQR